jgi:hypothetical protein
MQVTNIRFRDLVTFLAISGILLLTAARYVERLHCKCPVYQRSPKTLDSDLSESEAWLRRVLRSHRFDSLQPKPEIEEDNTHGC